jgi:sirohydrochlorin ferrochelatase
MDVDNELTAIILVDHGSRRDESNELLVEVAAAYRRHLGSRIVEPAHMELAEPSIDAAFARCVQQGATLIIVMPYFLAPGKHWNEDIPRLAAEAAARHPGVQHLVAPPLGIHPLMMRILDDRIAEVLGRQHDS